MIDFELMKLRANTRGWYFELCKDDLFIHTPHGNMLIRRDGRTDFEGRGHIHKALILEPRWTIERIINDPPTGWTSWDRFAKIVPYLHFSLTWGERNESGVYEILANITTHPEITNPSLRLEIMGGRDLVRIAERHLVAANFAQILAEISSDR